LQRWLRRPDFRSAYRAARRRVLDTAVAALQSATGKAVATLVKAMDEPNAQAAIRAAIACLDHAWKGTETADIADELAALRAEVQEIRDAKLLPPPPGATANGHRAGADRAGR
jgi:hypothetical protein